MFSVLSAMLVAGLFVMPAWAQESAPDTLASHNSERQNYPESWGGSNGRPSWNNTLSLGQTHWQYGTSSNTAHPQKIIRWHLVKRLARISLQATESH